MIENATGFYAVGGDQLEYRRIDGAGPTLVLLHEGLGCVRLWRGFPDALAARTGLGVMVYSRAGYGASSPCVLPRPVSFMHAEGQQVLGDVLAAAKIRDALLVGHSDGGSIALIHAGTHAPRVRGVATLAAHVFNEQICVDSIARAKVAYDQDDLRKRLARYHGANVDCAFRGWNDVWLHPDFRHWNIEQFLPSIRVPVLAIQGDQDEYGTGRQLDAIAAQVPDATIARLANCRHSPHLDQPSAVLDAIADWVARC